MEDLLQAWKDYKIMYVLQTCPLASDWLITHVECDCVYLL